MSRLFESADAGIFDMEHKDFESKKIEKTRGY